MYIIMHMYVFVCMYVCMYICNGSSSIGLCILYNDSVPFPVSRFSMYSSLFIVHNIQVVLYIHDVCNICI